MAPDAGGHAPTVRGAPQPEPTTSPTGQTLGSAAMALPTIHRGRGRTIAVAAGVLVVGGAIALLAMRSPGQGAPRVRGGRGVAAR